jgi:hypothetical protein
MELIEAVQQAHAMMKAITFSFGTANRCLITSED